MAGGTCSQSWQVRDLNTLEGDSGFANVNSNSITLQAGSYLLEALVPAYFTGAHLAKLVNAQNGQDVAFGTNAHSHPSAGSLTHSIIKMRLTLTEPASYVIQHRCAIERLNQGFGPALGFGSPEIFTTVTVQKLK